MLRGGERDAAETVADIFSQLIAHGMNPQILAMAACGISADLLAKTFGTQAAVQTLRKVADDMVDIEQAEPHPMH